MTDDIVRIRDIRKAYGEGDARVLVLNGIDLDIRANEVVALCGPSGSGKSTLMNIIGCLDRPSSGTYHLAGHDVSRLDRTQQAAFRLRYLGFIFQSFHLLAGSTALENVMLPLHYAGEKRSSAEARAQAMLERVGLQDRLHHRPGQLSGGQKQRVAIARALVARPRLLLADEPTGALDSRTGHDILKLLSQIHAESGLTILMVTHDSEVADWAQRRIDLHDGRVVPADPRSSPA